MTDNKLGSVLLLSPVEDLNNSRSEHRNEETYVRNHYHQRNNRFFSIEFPS